MSWAPAMGCVSIFCSRRSAGGQLEQPSEVKSSTRIGFGVGVEVSSPAGLASDCWAPISETCRATLKSAQTKPNAEERGVMNVMLAGLGRNIVNVLSFCESQIPHPVAKGATRVGHPHRVR